MPYSVQHVLSLVENGYITKNYGLISKAKERILAVFLHYLKMDHCMQTLIKRQKS